MDVIKKYFPHLNTFQSQQFEKLYSLYLYWNERINVISRKDIQNLYLHHVLHSLGIGKVIRFKNNTNVMDVGTGGGFPGIPLAILFPESNFLLVDSIAKKIKVVNEVVKELQLKNVCTLQERAENINQKFDFVVSRAVTNLSNFIPLVKNNFNKNSVNDLKNGILYLKGIDVTNELSGLNYKYKIHHLSNYFNEDFYKTKAIVQIEMN